MWKARNNVLHKDKVKSKYILRKQHLQERIDDLYKRGRENLTMKELIYFKLPVEQREKRCEKHDIMDKVSRSNFLEKGQS